MLKIGKYLDADAYQARIVPCLVKLFASPNRATRINLLKRIGDFSEYLTTKGEEAAGQYPPAHNPRILCTTPPSPQYPSCLALCSGHR